MGNTNGHTLLIGTSEGLYKAEPTKDGYATRKLGLEGLGDMRAAVVVDRNDPLIFYAGTIKGGMFRSRDGGETWASINKGLLHKTVWSITQHRETGDLYVGASPASVFVSKDQGDTWTECESLELMKETKEWTGPVPPYISRMKSLALVGSAPAIFGAIEEGWAVRSLDGGKTWEQIVAHVGMLAHDGHSIVVGGDGPDTVVVATGKGMFRSTDRGDHFEQVNEGLEERSYTSTPLASHPDRPGFLLSGVTRLALVAGTVPRAATLASHAARTAGAHGRFRRRACLPRVWASRGDWPSRPTTLRCASPVSRTARSGPATTPASPSNACSMASRQSLVSPLCNEEADRVASLQSVERKTQISGGSKRSQTRGAREIDERRRT